MSVTHLQNTFLWKASIYVGVSLFFFHVMLPVCDVARVQVFAYPITTYSLE